ncbi:transcription initiation factor IIA, gamma subunit, helical domain-containing protein [Entophlyctis helioformis]|nr:transcription initiation factor IIA, gamma subunit, helical domain-containing protein [Entophlyctis helioformis]KAI8924816.1 transcription initiation factor IIA, gamma subunit, helical domain-containing protein [Entophlyctis helioformis]
MSQYELYRRSSLGMALTDTLDELIQDGHVDPQTAMKVLAQFDSSFAEALRTKVRSKATIKGSLHIYRSCDDVWTFFVRNATLRIDNETIAADKIKLVACTAKTAPA